MTDPYGVIRKTPWLFLIFAVPALAIGGIGFALVWQETGSLADTVKSGTVAITALLGVATLIWGVVFTSRPIVELTPKAMVWPGGRRLNWPELASVEAGQTNTTVVSANTGRRNVVHEVMHLQHLDGQTTKLVTTWAAIGPQAANDRIADAFARRAGA